MSRPKILAVDDEEFNLDIIKTYLSNAGFEVICAEDGDVALQKIEEHQDISVVVLDRMMPRMNGMEVIKDLKQDSRYKHIPIVMQTAAAQTNQVIEGIDIGVYYYLAKPYPEELLVSIVNAAHRETQEIKEIEDETKKAGKIPPLIKSGRFSFSTVPDAKNLGYFLGKCFADPEEAGANLVSLFTNAIFANLSISHRDKTTLLMAGKLDDEVYRLSKREAFRDKKATVHIELHPDKITVRIKDQGRGFDWKKYMDYPPEQATNLYGRGMVRARSYFSNMDYFDNGTEVLCTKFHGSSNP